MASTAETSARRRTMEFPKPDADLAEWTNKIKALQRDVDADEEAEQRKLEEEIKASRLARSRRSSNFHIPNDLNIAQSARAPDDLADTTKITNRDDTILKTMDDLVDSSPLYVLANKKKRDTGSTVVSTMSGSSGSKPEPVSLAAFIGGRATGPRLSRPAPQPDAHDPNLFEQRALKDITSPHPVFGKGGIALAGLATKGRDIVQPRDEEADGMARCVSVPAPEKTWARERTVSSPSPFVPKAPEKLEASSSPMSISTGLGVRGRVESLYAHANRSIDKVHSQPIGNSKSAEKPPEKLVTPSKPDVFRRFPQGAGSVQQPASPTPRVPSVSQTPSRHTTPVSAPLARPIQSDARPSLPGSQIPPSKNTTSTFLKPSQQKDLTPSLSRLQGRGFVQSFVKLSSEIEAASASNAPDRSNSTRRNSVLDRWNPPSQDTQLAAPATPVSAVPLRRVKTVDASFTGSAQPASETQNPGTPPKPKAKPQMAATVKPPQAARVDPGPGSSNTLISYIKPNKTGDTALPNEPTKHTNDAVESDELGLRPRSRSRSRTRIGSRANSALAPATLPKTAKADFSSVSSGSPLTHLTKDRAKVRRKAVPLSKSSSYGDAPMQMAIVHGADPNLSAANALASNTVSFPKTTHEDEKQTLASGRPTTTNGRIRDTWVTQAPIAVKPIKKVPLANSSPTYPSLGPSKHALPGLASTKVPQSNVSTLLSPPPSPILASARRDSQPPPSPSRPSRIPSTGSRSTAIESAETIKASSIERAQRSSLFSSHVNVVSPEERYHDERTRGESGDDRTMTPASLKAERRRSAAGGHVGFTLPALKEERQPVASPVGTLESIGNEPGNAGLTPVATMAIAGTSPDVKPAAAKKPNYLQSSKVKIGEYRA